MEKNKEKTYTESQVSRYINSEGGKRYQTFLSENKYAKEAFEKKDTQEKGLELSSYFESRKWKLTANRQVKNVIDISLNEDIINKILKSEKCNNDKKIELITKAKTLEGKEKDLAKLQADIEAIKDEINTVI